MTAADWSVIGVIGTLILSAWGLVYLAKSSARETLKAQQEAVDNAVKDAVKENTTNLTNMFNAQLDNLRTQLANKNDQLTAANAVITQRNETIKARDKRIEDLEDRLYGRHQT